MVHRSVIVQFSTRVGLLLENDDLILVFEQKNQFGIF